MADGYPKTGLDPLARYLSVGTPLPSPAVLSEALRDVCSDRGGFSDREGWVERVKVRPVYEENAKLTRFLLLLAAHHAVPSSGGLTEDGAKAEHTDMLRPDRLTDDHFETVEHVAPQAPLESETSTKLYADRTNLHRLGNLTLVPLDDNASLGNRPWHEKRYLYRVLAAESPASAEEAAEQARAAGVTIDESRLEVLLERRRHLPVLQAVAAYEDDWTLEHVEARTEQMLDRAWRILDAWLGS
jgi:hypothetical protein